MADPLILSLDESCDARLVGGKAAGLAKLLAAGFAVPAGFCVTTAVYRHCLTEAGIDATEVWKKVLHISEEQRVQEQARIQQVLLEGSWPAGFQTDLELRLATLASHASRRWAVRSSATNEDAEQTSAAGLYRTTLGLSSEDVLRAIRGCWTSLWDDRVFQYLIQSGENFPCPAMAVVIQPMLEATVAGVASSIHPMTGRTAQVAINAIPGLASSLVGGNVTPDQYVVEVSEDSFQPLRVRRRNTARGRVR